MFIMMHFIVRMLVDQILDCCKYRITIRIFGIHIPYILEIPVSIASRCFHLDSCKTTARDTFIIRRSIHCTWLILTVCLSQKPLLRNFFQIIVAMTDLFVIKTGNRTRKRYIHTGISGFRQCTDAVAVFYNIMIMSCNTTIVINCRCMENLSVIVAVLNDSAAVSGYTAHGTAKSRIPYCTGIIALENRSASRNCTADSAGVITTIDIPLVHALLYYFFCIAAATLDSADNTADGSRLSAIDTCFIYTTFHSDSAFFITMLDQTDDSGSFAVPSC